MLSHTSKQPVPNRKLKESCSQCASAKVRCSKDKPQCTRCEDRDSICSYGMSRRSGRRAGSTSLTPQLTQLPASATSTYTGSSMATPTPVSQHMHQTSYSCNTLPLSTHSASETNYEVDDSTAFSPSDDAPFPEFYLDILDKYDLTLWAACESLDREMVNSKSPLNCLSPGYQPANDGSTIPLDQWMELGSNQCSMFHTNGEPTTSDFSTPLPTSRQQTPPKNKMALDITIQPSKPASCYQIATHILGVLHSTTTACSLISTMSEVNQRPTIEQVIDANRTSIDYATNILSCPCANDEQLLSLVTSIIFKVIQLYHGAANKGDDRPQLFGNGNFLREQGQHAASLVENLHLDGTDLPRMKAQLILGEIHRVVRLVELLSTRFQEARVTSNIPMGTDEDETSSDGNWISASVFVQLESDLRKRLRVVVKETMSVMRRI